jgi:hypothetical protein
MVQYQLTHNMPRRPVVAADQVELMAVQVLLFLLLLKQVAPVVHMAVVAEVQRV